MIDLGEDHNVDSNKDSPKDEVNNHVDFLDEPGIEKSQRLPNSKEFLVHEEVEPDREYANENADEKTTGKT